MSDNDQGREERRAWWGNIREQIGDKPRHDFGWPDHANANSCELRERRSAFEDSFFDFVDRLEPLTEGERRFQRFIENWIRHPPADVLKGTVLEKHGVYYPKINQHVADEFDLIDFLIRHGMPRLRRGAWQWFRRWQLSDQNRRWRRKRTKLKWGKML